MTLSESELQRYARHIVLPQFGGAGQQTLKSSSVLIVGAGGLGSPVVQYLAAAGVGKLVLIDDDQVSLSNLQRQTIHQTNKVALPKVESARDFAIALNPEIEVVAINARFNAENGPELVAGVDVVVDGSDNFDTRHLVADICEQCQTTLVSGAVGQFDGSITTLKPHATDEQGNLLPRYKDIFPKNDRATTLPTCEEAGILGALTGVVGSMQAMEVIKELTGIGDSLAGRLVMYDSKSARWTEIAYTRGHD